MYFHSFNIGFIDIPNLTTLNIYTVGCEHKCIGCQAPDLQDINHPERKELTIDLILDKINNAHGFIKGICWLGGDPLLQFGDFIKINQYLKENTDLVLAVYTGYEYLNLTKEQQEALLSCIDILIDGPWRRKSYFRFLVKSENLGQ